MTEETCSSLTELLKSDVPAKIHIGRAEAESLITFAEINQLQNASSTAVLQSQIRVLKEGTTLPVKSYERDGKIDNGAIEGFLREGVTIDYRYIENRWPAVKAFCDALQTAIITHCDFTLKEDLSVNMYLTPPGSKGLKPHYDRESVLIIQVGGEKKWSVYPAPVAFPMIEGGVQNPPAGSVLFSEILETGDVLYLPGGFVHEAETSPTSSSLHLTVSLWKLTGVDFFNSLMKRNPRFREPLKTKALRADSSVLAKLIEGLLPDLNAAEGQGAALAELIGVTTSHYSRVKNEGLGEYLASGKGFDGRTKYCVDAAVTEVYTTDNEVILCLPGQSVKFDLRFERTLRKLLKLESFSLAEAIPQVDALAAGFVIKALWNHGCLRVHVAD